MPTDTRAAVHTTAVELVGLLLGTSAHVLINAEQRITATTATGPFEARWAAALPGCGPAVQTAAGRALAVHLLFPADIAPETKHRLLARPPGVTEHLADAALTGVAPTGVASRLRRLSQVAYVLRAAAQRPADPAGGDVCADPAACRRWLLSVAAPAAGAQREALAHLLHPTAFEPIASPAMKSQIRRAFAAVAADAPDDDAALRVIREALTPRLGADFEFADPPARSLWQE